MGHETKHFLRKLGSTIRIGCTLMLARTFGQYEISIGAHDIEYAIYSWRGRRWAFPTRPLSAHGN